MLVRIVTPFSRPENVQVLYEHLASQGVIWHPLPGDTPWPVGFTADWIEPFPVSVPVGVDPFCYKLRTFAQSDWIVDRDRYCILNDDDLYEDGLLDAIRGHKERVLVVSMLRGDNTPETGNGHPASPLLAAVENMRPGKCGVEQYLVRGDVFRQMDFCLNRPDCDGVAASWLAATYGDEITYLPELHVLFNRLEPGRWNESLSLLPA